MKIHYQLITNKWTEPSNGYQCSNFSSIISKSYLSGSIYLCETYNNTFLYFKQKIKELTGLPLETMIEFCSYSNIYVDKSKNYSKYSFYDYTNLITYFGIGPNSNNLYYKSSKKLYNQSSNNFYIKSNNINFYGFK